MVGPSNHRGFLCVFSVYYTPFSATSALFGQSADTVTPAAFIPMTCHCWLMVLFPMTKSNCRSQKVYFWGGQSCAGFNCIAQRLYGQFRSFCQTCYQVYTHHIDNFSGCHSMSNTMKNKFGKIFAITFLQGCTYSISLLAHRIWASIHYAMRCHKISWNLEVARFGFRLFKSLYNLTGTSTDFNGILNTQNIL